jgi:hypothetical protein
MFSGSRSPSPSPSAQKREKKRLLRLFIFWVGFMQNFATRFFFNPIAGHTQKRDKTQRTVGELAWTFLSIVDFFVKSFRHGLWTFCKNICVVFLNSPYRKRTNAFSVGR